jgi:hypothetical protein
VVEDEAELEHPDEQDEEDRQDDRELDERLTASPSARIARGGLLAPSARIARGGLLAPSSAGHRTGSMRIAFERSKT